MPTSVFLLRRCRPSLLKAQAALAQHADWSLSGAATQPHEALLDIERRPPDVVVSDLQLQSGDAADFATLIRQRLSARRQLLLLTPSGDDPALFSAMHAGANGYTGDSGPALIQGLEHLSQSRASMTPLIARQTLRAFGLTRSPLQAALPSTASLDDAPACRHLDQSARHLLSLLAHGHLASEVATAWGLPLADIERRLWHIYRALHTAARGRMAA